MKNIFLGLGRLKMTALLTLLSVLSSALITFCIMIFLSEEKLLLALSISVITPIIITPLISWYILSLLFEINNLEKQQRKLATFDGLTGLLSRHAFYENTRSLLKLMKRNSESMTIAYIDIDLFKEINDTFGHDAGNKALKSFAGVLNSTARKSDLIGRLGGDEFIIALPHTSLESAKVVLNKIRDACESNTVRFNGHNIKFTISMGVSSDMAVSKDNLERFIKESDEALYEAKNSGKNRIAFYNKPASNAELFPS